MINVIKLMNWMNWGNLFVSLGFIYFIYLSCLLYAYFNSRGWHVLTCHPRGSFVFAHSRNPCTDWGCHGDASWRRRDAKIMCAIARVAGIRTTAVLILGSPLIYRVNLIQFDPGTGILMQKTRLVSSRIPNRRRSDFAPPTTVFSWSPRCLWRFFWWISFAKTRGFVTPVAEGCFLCIGDVHLSTYLPKRGILEDTTPTYCVPKDDFWSQKKQSETCLEPLSRTIITTPNAGAAPGSGAWHRTDFYWQNPPNWCIYKWNAQTSAGVAAIRKKQYTRNIPQIPGRVSWRPSGYSRSVPHCGMKCTPKCSYCGRECSIEAWPRVGPVILGVAPNCTQKNIVPPGRTSRKTAQKKLQFTTELPRVVVFSALWYSLRAILPRPLASLI